MKFRKLILSSIVILTLSTIGFSQPQSIADRIAVDNGIADQLYREGIKYETKRAILWVEQGGLTQEEFKDFGTLVNQGIIDIESYTGVKFDKKHYKTAKVEYFISSRSGIPHFSHESKPFIFLTPGRVKNRKTAYLHETTHVLVWKINDLWLQEGFASHVQSYVSKHYGGYLGFAFNPDNKPIDELAKSLLKAEISKQVLPLIGVNGTPLTMQPEQARMYFPIFTDRDVTAPAFYNLSESFVHFSLRKSA